MKYRTLTGKWLIVLAAATLLTLSAWVAWDNWGRFMHADALNTSSATTESAETLSRGKYLAHISGCVACHTAKGGDALSGNRRIDTPFGAVFSSNLTPSKTTGLGNWSEADFTSALTWGRSRSGRLLLPVFPYNHTSVLTPEDVHALYAWLKTVPAVEQVQLEHQLTWPLGTQPVIAVWRSLFFTPTPFKTNLTESEAWNRGAYLVQSAGHCAACHGQRNALGSFPAVNDVSGGFLFPQMWLAPSLTDPSQTTLGISTPSDIAHLLRAGQNQHAQASGPMAEFVQHSGQYLTQADALAIATYLKSNLKAATHTSNLTNTPLATSSPTAQHLYKTHCATCHGDHGEGKTQTYPALAGNPAVVLAQPDNLIQMVLYGGYGPSTASQPRPYGMPPYLFALNNQQIADVLNHVRSQWGNQAPAVSPMQVDRTRAARY